VGRRGIVLDLSLVFAVDESLEIAIAASYCD